MAAPLESSELGRVGSADRYPLRTLLRRMGQRDDPWKAMGRSAADLGRAEEAWTERNA